MAAKTDHGQTGPMPAGWRPALDRVGYRRYWDGRAWTDKYRPSLFGWFWRLSVRLFPPSHDVKCKEPR